MYNISRAYQHYRDTPETYIVINMISLESELDIRAINDKIVSVRVYFEGMLSQELYMDNIIKSQKMYNTVPMTKNILFLDIYDWLLNHRNTSFMIKYVNGAEDPIDVYLAKV